MKPSLILIIFSTFISFSVVAENAITIMKQIFIKSWVDESWVSGKCACLCYNPFFFFFFDKDNKCYISFLNHKNMFEHNRNLCFGVIMATHHVALKASQTVVRGLCLGPWNYWEKATKIRSSQIIRAFFPTKILLIYNICEIKINFIQC